MEAWETSEGLDWEATAVDDTAAFALPMGGGEPLYGDDPLETRMAEMASLRESRLSSEIERLNSELAASATRRRDQSEAESRGIKALAEKAEGELRVALEKERAEKGALAGEKAELERALAAERNEDRRLKALLGALEKEAEGARSAIGAAVRGAAVEKAKMEALNIELGRKLDELQRRLSEVERRYTAQVAHLEKEQERLKGEIELRAQSTRSAQDAAAAANHRADEAERGVRAWERIWDDQEGELRRRVEPLVRQEYENQLKSTLEMEHQAMEAEAARALDAQRQELSLRHEAAQAETKLQLLSERDAAIERLEREHTAARAAAVAAAGASAADYARAETERTLRERHASELSAVRRELETELKRSRDEVRDREHDAAAAVREELTVRHDKELADAVARARHEGEATARAELEPRINLAREERDAARESARLEKAERISAAEQAGKIRGDAEIRLQEESLRRLAASQEESRARSEGDLAVLRARLEAEREKSLAEVRARKDIEVAELTNRLEKERERLEGEVLRKVRKEAEIELNSRADRMSQEWQRIKVRFEEELSKMRDEMKRREREFTDEIAARDHELTRSKEEMKIHVMRVEKELLAASEERSLLAEAKIKLEDQLKAAGGEAADKLVELRNQRDVEAAKAKADKETGDKKLDDLRKDLEGKMKVLDLQLREERKKNVALLERIKEMETASIWKKISG